MRLWFLSLILLLVGAETTKAQLLHDLIHDEVELFSSKTTKVGKVTTLSSVTKDLSAEFTGIALQGFAACDSLAGFVRLFEDNSWGEWQSLYLVRSATDEAFLAAYRSGQVRKASKFELRFQIDSVCSLQIMSVGTFDRRLDGQHEIEQSSQKIEDTSDFLIKTPHIRRRSEWRAKPFRGSPIALNRPTYDYMTMHHTAGFAATTLREGLEQVRRIQDFHQNGRGWSDIGYQFLMDQDGRLYQGRPFLDESTSFDQGPRLAQGAHVGGANRGNIGVSLMGCYHPPEGAGCRDEMTPFAIDSLIATFGFLSERYSLSPEDMRGHRDFGGTACPGDNNYFQLADFMLRVEDLLRNGNFVLGEGSITASVNAAGLVMLQWIFLADFGIEEYVIQRRAEDGSLEVISTGVGATDGSDTDTPSVGQYTYELIARNKRGQEQRLASTKIVIEPSEENILTQSFPNPTSSTTTIRYFLESGSGIVSVDLFDLAGRRVLTGDEQYREAGEWYVTTLDTSFLPGGIYFYRILVDGFSSVEFNQTEQLIVLR